MLPEPVLPEPALVLLVPVLGLVQVARAHTPTVIPDPEPELELVPGLEPVVGFVPAPVLEPVLVPPPPPLGVVQVAARHTWACTPLLLAETCALVPVVPAGVQVPRAHTPTLIPPPLVLVLAGVVWAAVRVVTAAGGLVPGGDWAAWAAVWLSRNIPPAPAARIRPRWMMFMACGFPSPVMT